MPAMSTVESEERRDVRLWQAICVVRHHSNASATSDEYCFPPERTNVNVKDPSDYTLSFYECGRVHRTQVSRRRPSYVLDVGLCCEREFECTTIHWHSPIHQRVRLLSGTA
ncbi:hypothetical protein L226DRAFT_533951 [Lentinus tigrinus ALCF2SS1-7]|uniref:uncharacterized protein n=1 Tax=Lentinus tigrinus ALCF2SS1-7 TaxID=1328758 RepID=UPI001166240D|nr:hypothetical protein L226DRAFT_533951 [Lentinus tigrinus ALCF2SS1-7]